MKSESDRKSLADALTVTKRTVGGTLPALQCVLLQGTAGHLTATSTDLSTITIADVLDSAVHDEGRVLVPLAALQSLVKTMDGERLTLTVEDDRLHLDNGEVQVNVKAMYIEDYPLVPEVPNHAVEGVPVDRFADLLRCLSKPEQKYAGRPEYEVMHMQPDGLYASDGYRLAWVDQPMPVNAALPYSLIDALLKAKLSDVLVFADSLDEPTRIAFAAPTNRLHVT
ncbi:MAG: DNA polymerase III subunit beta, partial [Dehalococcoidia bacterium]